MNEYKYEHPISEMQCTLIKNILHMCNKFYTLSKISINSFIDINLNDNLYSKEKLFLKLFQFVFIPIKS
jgi:hypothetical protein